MKVGPPSTSFAKTARPQDRHDRFLSVFIDNGKLHAAALDMYFTPLAGSPCDRFSRIFAPHNTPRGARAIQKSLQIESESRLWRGLVRQLLRQLHAAESIWMANKCELFRNLIISLQMGLVAQVNRRASGAAQDWFASKGLVVGQSGPRKACS